MTKISKKKLARQKELRARELWEENNRAQREVDAKVKNVLNSIGGYIPGASSYYNFARQVSRVQKTWAKGRILEKEVGLLITTWVGRGLDKVIALRVVREVFSIDYPES